MHAGFATRGLVVAAAAGNNTGRGSRLRASTPKGGTAVRNRDWGTILGDQHPAWSRSSHSQAATQVADTEDQLDYYDDSYDFSAEIFSDEAANDLLHHSLKVSMARVGS